MKERLHVLIVEDDPYISDLLKLYLIREGFEVSIAIDGEKGWEKYFDEQPDFVILDIMLPKMDGWEVCREIRRDERKIPILMLTGKGESYDKIKGLDMGADDYVVKPFEPKEIIARMQAILRRTHPNNHERKPLAFEKLEIDIQQHQLWRGEDSLFLPPKELELLYFLATEKNQVFTRQQLVDRIWGFDYEGDVRTIDVHIKRIREKIGDEWPHWKLKTIRGVGYKFEVNERV
ncbi:response regulator transcription factor [Salipaludibacillus sp. LMS25]|jgi:DNA-binding response OmpR family regulator|uniref:response regulator transcription factor n=1 Tax=Salipaludibacillus sp. LMS25 TaxID=2924031 RepID=UPI0020D1751B|nr:response regulator transcription factor [Salipaludibacillus sp. LMS25]UTR14046.1 response regulator transcription factor [Salipaludibacillus sp. LMS25]